MDNKAIGARLRELRGDRSQQEIANAIGVEVMTISNYERGERVPNDENKIKLANYFGKTVQDIFFTTE
jgi:DNA-binding XRE family transcriptional regulator